MIQIQKGKPPAVLLKKGAEFQEEAVSYHKDPAAYDRPFKSDFDKHAFDEDGVLNGFTSKLFTVYSFYSDPTVKRQLIQEHSGKCAFCESFIMDTDVGDVEHYRPKTEVTEINPKDTEQERPVPGHPGYFWLSQTWENLFLSCKQCNQAYKRTRFDVVASGMAALDEKLGDFPRLPIGKGPDPRLEVPMLLYPGPADVNPREVIRFDPATARAYPSGKDEDLNLTRANRTIELVGLNRARLLEARASHLLHLRGLFILAATQGYVAENKDQYSIFDFKYAKDCAGKDAQKALESAGLNNAEFSALAQDAISEWSKELKLGKSDAKIAQKDEIQLNVNINWDLRLDKQIELLEKYRKVSASILDQEAEPDTYDLDLDYNETLAQYKQIVGRVSKDKKKIEAAHEKVSALNEKNKDLKDQVDGLKNNLWEIDEKLKDEPSDKDQENRKKLEKMKLDIEEELKDPEKKYDAILETIADTEAIFESYSTQLVDLLSDVIDLQTGYVNCNGKVKDRTARTKKLQNSIDNLTNWVNGDKALTEDVKLHLKKKGWPPRITGL